MASGTGAAHTAMATDLVTVPNTGDLAEDVKNMSKGVAEVLSRKRAAGDDGREAAIADGVFRNDRLERAISTSCWVENLTSCRCPREGKASRVRFSPLESTVTLDAENITPDEAVVFFGSRPTGIAAATPDMAVPGAAAVDCNNIGTVAVTSIRAAAEIVNSIASSTFLQFSMYSSRSLIPLFMATSKKTEFGKSVIKSRSLKRCFARTQVIDSLLGELRKRKVNAAKAFGDAVREKSAVNAALAAWNAGNAATLEKLIEFCKIKYGSNRSYENAGLCRAAVGAAEAITGKAFLAEIITRHKGDLDLDSASRVFDEAIVRVFSEFKTAVGAADGESSPSFVAVRHNSRRMGLADDVSNLGMLAPRSKYTASQYMRAEALRFSRDGTGNGSSAAATATEISAAVESVRAGGKRESSTPADEARRTLADSVAEAAMDVPAFSSGAQTMTVADIYKNAGEGYEWSLHITQLFAQAFLESMSTLLSCAFGIEKPFSDEGFEIMASVIRKTTAEGVSDMDPSSLADRYLLLTGNFQVAPFHASDPYDVVGGRQVTPNTPMLTLVEVRENSDKKKTTVIEFRDRLLVKDAKLNDAAANSGGDPSRPTLRGCLPVIRGPLFFERNLPQSGPGANANTDAQDSMSSLANDWYASVGVLYATGRTAAAIAAGHERALSSVATLQDSSETSKKSLNNFDEKRKKRAMRKNADEMARLMVLLGQASASWGFGEHVSTLDTFWSSSSAVASKTIDDALGRARVLSIRRQLDGKCEGNPATAAAEAFLRDSFFRSVYGAAGPGEDTVTGAWPSSKFGKAISSHKLGETAEESWMQYTQSIEQLTKHERAAFNVEGLRTAMEKFKFPLISSGKNSERRRRENLKAANAIINGITVMTLQTAVDGMRVDEMDMGLGSVKEGWGRYGNVVQPSRLAALKSMSKYGSKSAVIPVPVSRSLAGRGRVTTVDIPVALISQLVSDKKTLDGLCGENTDLGTEISKFVASLSGTDGVGRTSIFTQAKYSKVLLRYIWFNTAIVSLTDSNITSTLDFVGHLSDGGRGYTPSSGLGAAMYRDYLSVRRLVNNYNSSLAGRSVEMLASRLNGAGRKDKPKNCAIKTEAELQAVLKQTANALSAFTENEGGTAPEDTGLISSIREDDVLGLEILLSYEDDRVKRARDMFNFLFDIYLLNKNIEPYLARLVGGQDLSEEERGNLVHPNMTAIFRSGLNVTGGTPLKRRLGEKCVVTIDLNVDQPMLAKAAAGLVAAEVAASSQPNSETTKRIADLMEDQRSQTFREIKRTVTVPGFLSAEAAIAIFNAFTLDGRFSNKTTHLGIVAKAIVSMCKFIREDEDRVSVGMKDVSEFVRNGLLFSLVTSQTEAGSYMIEAIVKDFSGLLLDTVAETSLAVSRLQKSFYPIPPAIFSFGAMYRPDAKSFRDMVHQYVSEIVRNMSAATTPGGCDDSLGAERLFRAGDRYAANLDASETAGGATNLERKLLNANLENPAKLWSLLAIPHFDVAVSPKLHGGISSDQKFRLSTYYQGIHRLALDPECKPAEWERTLAGNRAGDFFGLREVTDNNLSFNSALDTVLAHPAEVCDLVSREMVRSSNDVVHNIGAKANSSVMRKLVEGGVSAVKRYDSAEPTLLERRVGDTVSYLAKTSYVSKQGNDTAREIVKTWNTPALLDNDAFGPLRPEKDPIRAPLEAVPALRQNVVEATRSLYELAALCTVLSKDETVRNDCHKIMSTFERTSPVMADIGVSRIAGLVGSVTSNKQYKKFLRTVSEYRTNLVRRVSTNPLAAGGMGVGGAGYSLRAVYDGMASAARGDPDAPEIGSSRSVSLPDRFWMGVFAECLDSESSDFAEHRRASSARLYGSRLNTYAALSANADRIRHAVASERSSRGDEIAKAVKEIEVYLSNVLKDDTIKNVVAAQQAYNKISDITANSVYNDFRSGDCRGFSSVRSAGGKARTARQQSDAILAGLLRDMAGDLLGEQPELAAHLSLATHVITAKGVYPELNGVTNRETFENLLSVAGVAEFSHVSANAVCERLKHSDVATFLGGAVLQQGLFLTFLLNNVLFSQVAETVRMDKLSAETKSILVKLVGFCGTVTDAMSTKHIGSVGSIRRRAGKAGDEARLDTSFVASLFSSYNNLRRGADFLRDTETISRCIADADLRSRPHWSAPRSKKNSKLEDVLRAPAVIHKSFMTCFAERAASTRQVRREGNMVLANGNMARIYGRDVLGHMRSHHRSPTSSYYHEDECAEEEMDRFCGGTGFDPCFRRIDSDSSSTLSSSSSSEDSSDDSELSDYSENGGGGRPSYSYDALDGLNATAKPLKAIYGCADGYGDFDEDSESEYDSLRRGGSKLGAVIKDVAESEGEADDDDDDDGGAFYSDQSAIRRRFERIQHGPGFLAHSFILNNPSRARAFLMSGKRFKRSTQGDYLMPADDDHEIFSDEESSSSDSSSYSSDEGYAGRRKLKRRPRDQQFAFVGRLLRAFVPTSVTITDGKVTAVGPANSETAAGFFENYQRADKKTRARLRREYGIDKDQSPSLRNEFFTGSGASNPRGLRRSLIRTAAAANRTQRKNAEILHQVFVGTAEPIAASSIISENVFFSRELEAVVQVRNKLLKGLSDISMALFTSSVDKLGSDEIKMQEARKEVTKGADSAPGYLGVPLRNLSACLPSLTDGGKVSELLAVTDKNHLDWMTLAAVSFTRAFNVATFYALQSTLKTATALKDMYSAFSDLISSNTGERVRVNSALLDSIFNTRMAHLEAAMGLIYPTSFVNHELPADLSRRLKFQTLALNILRGVNSKQLPRADIGDTSGLLAFVTSSKFAGRGGERGGLSLYRMSVTDALSCEPAVKRLKGAVSLEVGKWRMPENSVFSKKSAELVKYCRENSLSLEKSVGPVARFLPNGTPPKEAGLSEHPSLYVQDDDAARRLRRAEEDCGSAGKFITASAMGNLFGKIDDIVSMSNKFSATYTILRLTSSPSDPAALVKELVGKMRFNRSRSLRTPYGGSTSSRPANLPALSDAIVLRARELKHSIAAVVSDLSKKHGIGSRLAATPAKVSAASFERILETSVVLSVAKNNLRGIENRLAAAYNSLKQFKHISEDGLSESKAVIAVVAENLNTLDVDVDVNAGEGEGENGRAKRRLNVAEFLAEDGILKFITDTELKYIDDARRHVTTSLEGIRQLHAKMLSIVTAASDRAASLRGDWRALGGADRLAQRSSVGGNFEAVNSPSYGTIIKHKETGVWLKTDEDCNTQRARDGSEHKRVASAIMTIVENNREQAIRSRIQTMCLGKYAMNDIFAVDDSDARSIDRLTGKLQEALSEGTRADENLSSSASAVDPASTKGTAFSSSLAEGEASSSIRTTSATSPPLSSVSAHASTNALDKTIPFIPIIFENRRPDIKESGEGAGSINSAEKAAAEQKAGATCQLELQESRDLSNILPVASRHRFAAYNQSAIVDMFAGRQNAEVILPEKERRQFTSESKNYRGIMARLPAHQTLFEGADSGAPVGTNLQLPQDSVAAGAAASSSNKNGDRPLTVHEKLRRYAKETVSVLTDSLEFRNLAEAQKKISAALKHAASVEATSFFAGGVRLELNQDTMLALSQAQSVKEGALEILDKIIRMLESYVPDQSLANPSLPLNGGSASGEAPGSGKLIPGESEGGVGVTDYFQYAHDKLQFQIQRGDQGGFVTGSIANVVEQDSAIRIPLLLSYPDYASTLRSVVSDVDDYFRAIERINLQITADSKRAVADAIAETDREIEADKKSLIPIIEKLKEMYSEESDEIKTAVRILENKKSELELQNQRTRGIIDSITERIEVGDNAANVNDMLDYGSKADNDRQFLQNLTVFARDNSGAAYSPHGAEVDSSAAASSSDSTDGKMATGVRDSYRNLLTDAINTIKRGQTTVTADFSPALDDFPVSSTEPGEYSTLTMHIAEKKQRERLAAVEKYIGIIDNRISKLHERLSQSSKESAEIDSKKGKIDSMFRRQIEDRRDDAVKMAKIAEMAAGSAISKDLAQSPLMVAVNNRVDNLFAKFERLEEVVTSPIAAASVGGGAGTGTGAETGKTPVSDPSHTCFLFPLHDSIRRISAMYQKNRKGPLSNARGVATSDADIQLMTISDLSHDVLSSMADGPSDHLNTLSSVVPGLCQHCAMMLTNLHEAHHKSYHSFNFENGKSRQKLREMLSAALRETDDTKTRSNVLSLLDANNGYVKELSFTQKQKVVCMTPVNTMLGSTFNGNVAPNTVVVPTSELFNCPGVDNDKFRSMIHRSCHDKMVADAPKSSASIVETLARTSPNAENLYFPFKDERRHFNSIADAIIFGMSPEASSLLNTTCDQNLVSVDEGTGFPLFEGRRPGRNRIIETKETQAAVSNSGGMPACPNSKNGFVDMGAKFMVAPGSLLNANKEETLRLNRISDINNARHYGNDVHVAGANSAWRIGEVMRAASTCSDEDAQARKMLLLGSVSAVCAQKTAQYINDPTAMLNTSTAIHNLVSSAFPAPLASSSHVGAAEAAFATQLAYRQRLFPDRCRGVFGGRDDHARPIDVLSRSRRYGDAFRNIVRERDAAATALAGAGIGIRTRKGEPCEALKRAISNTPLLSTSYGIFEEISSSITNGLSQTAYGHGLGAPDADSFSKNNTDKKDVGAAVSQAAVNGLAVQAMTDSVIDTLSAMTSITGRGGLPPSAVGGLHRLSSSDLGGRSLIDSISRISRDARLLSNAAGGSGMGLVDPSRVGSSYLNSLLKSSASPAHFANSGGPMDHSDAAEAALSSILDAARENDLRLGRLGISGPWGAGRPENRALQRAALAAVLQMNEDEITRDIKEIDNRIETRQLREAFHDLKRSMLVSSAVSGSLGGPTPSSRYPSAMAAGSSSAPLSLLVSRMDAASGTLRSNATNSNLIMNAVDDFNTTPLLVRHMFLDPGKTPVSLAKEVRGVLTHPKAVTARALLSEASPLLTELCLYNTRDTQPERAVDRLLLSTYLVKQAKRFDGVDPVFPAALTCACHLMLSSADSKNRTSHFLNNIKLHVNDTSCYFKNIERYERLLGRYGDLYAMSHRQNCNCPFTLHHNFEPSDDEHLVPSFAYARPEVTAAEIRATPYQMNKLLNDKHYVMKLTKIDNRMTGSALLKKLSEWSEMRTVANFNGLFEPSRLALSNSGMTTAGVNLDFIVKPDNARNVMGILECHRHHVCSVDAKASVAAAVPAVLNSTDGAGNLSELVQNALPRNRYIQKSTVNAHTVIFSNIIEQLITDLGRVIVSELAEVLAETVPATVYENTREMMDRLGSENLFGRPGNDESGPGLGDVEGDGADTGAKLVSENMKNAIYQNLISGKMADPENVPFSSTASGPLAYDFLLSKEGTTAENDVERAAASTVSSTTASALRGHLARVFEAVSRQVSDSDFVKIMDDIEAKIMDESALGDTGCARRHGGPTHPRYSSEVFAAAIRSDFNRIMSFLKILRSNITPVLTDPEGPLAQKMAVYLSLLSAKSKLENLFQYGLSNSSSVDLSHLKPVNGSNGNKNIEDTFMYRNVHPVLVMAMPENFTALFQQEQTDPEQAIDNRRAMATFLNHPNTAPMADGARAALGAGGGNPMGIYLSSHILHESTVNTADPIRDSHAHLSYHSSVTRDPIMVVNPFKDSSHIDLVRSPSAMFNDGGCTYLQVSMPSESSGLLTNTGYAAASSSPGAGRTSGSSFSYVRRDGTRVNLPCITPAVLCSDASSNLLDLFSRANVVLRDVNLRFGFMPEIISALAKVKNVNREEIVKEMVSRSSLGGVTANAEGGPVKNASLDPKTGDVVVKNGIFPDTRPLYFAGTAAKWGDGGQQQKLHARALSTFAVGNPLAFAAVNGIPLTSEGILLVEEKRRRASGISPLEGTGRLGAGCLGTGALRAAANSKLASDLEPLRRGWENIINLQSIFSKAAADIKSALNSKSGGLGKYSEVDTANVVGKLYNNFRILNECKDILQDQTSLLVATSDLVTGGYAGDPSVAMVSPVRPENLGIVGAISSTVRGLGHLAKREGVENVNSAIREKLNMSTSNGTTIPEHGIVHKSSRELLADAESVYHLYGTAAASSSSLYSSAFEGVGSKTNLGKIMALLGLKRAVSTGTTGAYGSASNGIGHTVGTFVYAHEHGGGLLASPEYGNRHDLVKRQSVVQLLMANPDLFSNVSNALFLTLGKSSAPPFNPCATTDGLGGALYSQAGHSYDGNVQALNRLFGSRLSGH